MFPKRKLLYHRGIDDHVGTYVTDYVFSFVCFVLCVQLLVRIARERRRMKKDQRMTSSCRHLPNWLPWNWPKERPTPVTMSTYAVLLFGFSNIMMTLLGGLTHQFLQTVEPYNGEVSELWQWLVVWRAGASFSALLCLSLLILSEQLITQEGIVSLPRVVRIIYYVFIISSCVIFLGYNYAPLSGKDEDPFSVRQSFVVSFGVMIVYGIITITVLIHNFCCRVRESRPYSSSDETRYSPAYSVESRHSEVRPYRREIYSCCKTMVVRCHNNETDVTSRRWELFLTFISPWIFVAAGAMNHFLKGKCADSDEAFTELGCPLPDAFNHNAAMHVIQIFSAVGFFLAENLSITRRTKLDNSKVRRVTTSSTLYNDVVNSCVIVDSELEEKDRRSVARDLVCNNNKPNGRDDVICEMTCEITTQETNDVITTPSVVSDDVTEPKFPISLNYEAGVGEYRFSLYDNLSTQTQQ